ncbi:MAG: hypothetical protein HYV94_10775 [Candidatus Rokubacteria bacterium]|nr:hypothetical protein [Candidatus Rokubacteria bacterium]MBI2492563.1 hypothetical protein [Candidatus Rokubacteria bacterium]
MLRRIGIVVVTLAAGLVLGLGTMALGQEGAQKMKMQKMGRGAHPHITAALQALTRAERQLEEAAHVYGGHRAKALELVKQAKKEVQDGIEYAKAQPKGQGKAPAAKTQ